LVVERIPPGEAQVEAVISVLHRWATVDPIGAASWVEKFPGSDVRERALNEIAAVTGSSRS
jgi:hypothetical protein